jgi:hypothetical protein
MKKLIVKDGIVVGEFDGVGCGIECPPGVDVAIGWTYDGQTFFPPVPTVESLVDLQRNALRKIDANVDAIYRAVIGNRASEYEQAEAEAKAYKAAGYQVSPVPTYVQDWADAKAATPTWAADNIIATATQWRSVQGSLRANRLTTKEVIRTAADKASIDVVLTTWAEFIGTTKADLNI